MFKFTHNRIWFWDAEWAGCPDTGRRLLGLHDSVPDRQVIEALWRYSGATESEPKPYLKTALCRVLSIAVLERRSGDGPVALKLMSLPKRDALSSPEKVILQSFLDGLGNVRPQICGYNSVEADMPAIIQRAAACGVHAPGACRRPDKPWEGVDYFAKYSDWHVDLRTVLGGFGKASPKLNELAAAFRIPGKMETSGADVAELYLAGEIGKIIDYNELDALTTYLVWLAVASLAGHVTPGARQAEHLACIDLLQRGARAGAAHLGAFLTEWCRLAPEVAALV